jgi:hypothetical protein
LSVDVAGARRIMNNTYDVYKTNAKVKPVLDNVIDNSLSKMKIAPFFKVVLYISLNY